MNFGFLASGTAHPGENDRVIVHTAHRVFVLITSVPTTSDYDALYVVARAFGVKQLGSGLDMTVLNSMTF
jgi:hypothetical protein